MGSKSCDHVCRSCDHVCRACKELVTFLSSKRYIGKGVTIDRFVGVS